MDNLSQGLGPLVSFQPHRFRSQNGRGKGGLVFLGQFLGPAILNHSGQSDRLLIICLPNSHANPAGRW